MEFVLCSDLVYQEDYDRESYKYPRVLCHRSLIGWPKVHVIVHEGWEEDVCDERVEYLEQQLEALADFGFIKLFYISEEGWRDRHPSAIPLKKKEVQGDMFKEGGFGDSVFFEEKAPSVIAYEVEDEDCAGGSCKI